MQFVKHEMAAAKTMAVMVIAGAVFAGCAEDVELNQLGDLSMLVDCELPEGYTAYQLTEVQTDRMDQECPLEGLDVIIRATPVSSALCTAMECLDEDECCNHCSGGFQIPGNGGDTREIILISTDEYPISYHASTRSSDTDICIESCDGLECDVEQIVWGSYHCEVLGEWSGNPYFYHQLSVKGACLL